MGLFYVHIYASDGKTFFEFIPQLDLCYRMHQVLLFLISIT